MNAILTAILTLTMSGDTLSTATVTASLKEEPVATASVSTLGVRLLEQQNVRSAKDASALLPNFYQPDYGSQTTSSIYVRGFGSRIDQPSIGLYVDEIPVLNKSAYDFELLDVQAVRLLRGPQGTLYGRNASTGVLSVTTRVPFEAAGVRAMGYYSPKGAFRASVSLGGQDATGRLGYSAAAYGSHYDGDFVNVRTGEACDWSDSGGARLRLKWLAGQRWSLENILSAGYVREGGYAYRQVDAADGTILPVSYNDPCGYRRFTLTEGLLAKGATDRLRWSAILSWQHLDDRMDLDNDFTDLSLFSLVQEQREDALTFEGLLRRADPGAAWQPLSGVFVFGRDLHIKAPVTFKRDGIEQLILAGANRGIASAIPGAAIEIAERQFPIGSAFHIPTFGAALFHQSSWRTGRWTFTAGLRLDFEHTRMDYDSTGDLSYRFNLTMPAFAPLHSSFEGRERQSFLELLPSVSAVYDFGKGQAYAAIRRGHKAGGFNTQIFSDILQNIMMNDMMAALGVHPASAGPSSTARATAYDPESAWDFEAGLHWSPSGWLTADVCAFLIECRDQQVTVLPPGNGTGRMMSNAARSRSVGGEGSLSAVRGGLTARLDYGLALARFVDYQYDAATNYGGNWLPYAPQQTLSAAVSYRHQTARGLLDWVEASLDCHGAGRIWWDEANTLCQPFYILPGASVSARSGRFTLTLWGRNLADRAYHTFYFRSVGRSFYADGRPCRIGIRLNIDI